MNKSSLKLIDELFCNNYNLIKYNKHFYGKVVNGEIIHYVYLQEDKNRLPLFMLTVVSRSLFFPKDVTTLAPGARIYKFQEIDKDIWLSSEEKNIESSIGFIKKIMGEKVMPFWDAISNRSGYIETFEKDGLHVGKLSWASEAWRDYEMAYLYLKDKQFTKAEFLLNRLLSSKESLKFVPEWLKRISIESNEIINHVKQEKEQKINDLLTQVFEKNLDQIKDFGVPRSA